jgi:hypothetical protein
MAALEVPERPWYLRITATARDRRDRARSGLRIVPHDVLPFTIKS